MAIIKGKLIKNSNIYLHKYQCRRCHESKSVKDTRKDYEHGLICSNCRNKIKSVFVSFRYYKNNKIEKAASVTDFCKKHPELGGNAKFHFSLVLHKKRLHYKGWMLSDNKEKIDLNKVEKVEQILIKKAII